MLDREGYRPNVGIVLLDEKNRVFWGKRAREQAWQFPQGGIKPGESPETAMYRELYEEIGLMPQHVRPNARLAALRRPHQLDTARMARSISRAKTDLVSAALYRQRGRRRFAHNRAA